MKILIVGESIQFEEGRGKLGQHDYIHVTSHDAASEALTDREIVFDFLASENPGAVRIYSNNSVTVFLNAWRLCLSDFCQPFRNGIHCTVFGFNGFPTMFNREFLEISMLNSSDLRALENICASLKTPFIQVDDRVGLVTPRVVCMIINEAYYTIQEGTASREDIDLAMKLGTNYPYGPFEWCEKIGVKNVYRLLEAVYQDTKDERYKISALLKKECFSY